MLGLWVPCTVHGTVTGGVPLILAYSQLNRAQLHNLTQLEPSFKGYVNSSDFKSVV